MEWTIKQVSEITGISADTLRYYDKEGIISPKRRENGYRYYDETDIMSLKNIAVMKYAHFTLAEIKHMEKVVHQDPSAECNEISRNVLNAKIKSLNQEIHNFQKIVSLMEELLPMIECSETYYLNKDKIGEFISQIFDDINRKD